MRFLDLLFLTFLLPFPTYADQLENGVAARGRQDYQTALKYLQPLADQGDPEAQSQIGSMYEYGQGVEKDHNEAMKWVGKLQSAADRGNPEAQWVLGEMYYSGTGGVHKDETEAQNWWQKAAHIWQSLADKGDAEAQYSLANMYGTGNGVHRDQAESLKWFRKAADQGYPKALFAIGMKYTLGDGVPKDPNEGMKWIRKAADQDLAVAQWTVGYLYERGEGAKQDYAEAEKWIRMAADQGKPEAIRWLADVKRNEKLQQEADQGNVEKQLSLAVMSLRGENHVPQNYAEAMKWARKVADKGDWRGQELIGVMYQQGLGVKQNDPEALKWFRKAAAQGESLAMLWIGWIYDAGLSVPKDPVEVYYWYSLSKKSMNGVTPGWDAVGDIALDAAKQRLPPEQIVSVEKRLQDWKPSPPRPSSFPNRIPNDLPLVPATLAGLLTGATQVTLYSLEEMYVKNITERFHGYPVLGKIELNGFEATKASKAFQEAFDPSGGWAPSCFAPHHGLRMTVNGRSYDYLLCYTCDGIAVYQDDKELALLLARGSPDNLNGILKAHSIRISAAATSEFINRLRKQEAPALPTKEAH